MRNALIVSSSIITIAAIVPYLSHILKKQTKPRVVSWFIWSLLAGISAAASLSNKQYAAFVLSASGAIECMAVVILGLTFGEREYELLDILCFIGAILVLILWYIFNSPSLAIIAVIIIDLIGTVPTLKHAWMKPGEETWITYALSGLGATLAVLAATTVRITSLANPIYLIVINLVLTVLILRRKAKQLV